MAAESWSAWLSSGTACFLFFNAIVCAVAVLSWGRGGDAALSARRKRLTRSASSMVMDRLRSVSSTIFSFQYGPAADDFDSVAPPASQLHHVQQEYCYTSQEGGEMRPAVVNEVEPEPAVPIVESMAATMAPLWTPSAPVAVTEELFAAVSTSGSEKEEADSTRQEMTTPAAAAAKGAAALERRRKWKVAGIVERRAHAEMADKAEVNARADRFIRQFREDLKLERLISILSCGHSTLSRA